MKSRRTIRTRLRIEELETRLAPSTSPMSIYHAADSTNWSGYAVQTTPASGVVTMASGSWIVPAVTGSGTSYSSFWVGIDGYSSNSVEQIGTDSDLVNGVPTYYAWYEMYPNPSQNIASLTIHVGDTVNASVTYAGSNSYLLTLTDGAQSFSITKTSARDARSSAEWIAEAPSSSRGVLPLANFGTVNFSNAQAKISGTTGAIDNAAWQNTAINMINSRGATIALTSDLNDSVNPSSFSVAFETASSGSGSGGSGHHGRGGNGHSGDLDFLVPTSSSAQLQPSSNFAQSAVFTTPAVANPTPFQTPIVPANSIVAATVRLAPLGETVSDEFDLIVPAQPAAPESPAPRPNRNAPRAAPAPLIPAAPTRQQMADHLPRFEETASRTENFVRADVPAQIGEEFPGSRSLRTLFAFIGSIGAVAVFSNFTSTSTEATEEEKRQPRRQ